MEIKEIKARDGYYLTQSAEVEDRIFVTALKGANIKESDWREATLEEKVLFDKSQEPEEEQL